MRVLIDTGSTHSFIRASILGLVRHGPIQTNMIDLFMADGRTPFPVLGEVSLNFNIKNIRTKNKVLVVKELCCDCLVGIDWIRNNSVTLDIYNQQLTARSGNRQATVKLETDMESISFPVRSINKIMIPPYQQVIVKAHVPISSSQKTLFTPRPHLEYNKSIELPSAVLNIQHYTTYLTISNPTNRRCILAPNTRLGDVIQMGSAFTLSTITRSMCPTSSPNNIIQTPPPESITSIINNLTRHIPSLNDDQHKLRTILTKYSAIFDTVNPRIADTTSVHTIRTGDAATQNSRAYPQNNEQRTETEKIIDKMLHAKQIRPSISPWSSPMLLARKKDGSFRFVVGYRKLNAITTKDAYPMPTIEETLQKLGGHTFFTKMDLASDYFQIPIREEDKPKTAFTTARGLYEFNVLPQGLRNASASFQRIMNTILVNKRESYCIVYMDDILIFSETFNDHLQHVEEIMRILDKHRFTVSPAKCSMAQSNIDYLGHSISGEGVTPLGDNMAPILTMPEPRSLKEANLFIGGLGFYRRFIKDFAKLAAPIYAVTNKSKARRGEFYWGDKQSAAFQSLKKALTSKPLFLHFPEPNQPLLLSTDASDNRIGAVLKQKSADNKLHVISYFSQMLSTTQQRYSTIEKEALAIHTALEKLRPYVINHEVTIETDHCPLCNFHRRTTRNRRIDFWSIDLADYNIKEIKYKKGSCNCDADLLSRYPINASIGAITRSMTRKVTTSSSPSPSSEVSINSHPTLTDNNSPQVRISPIDLSRIREEQQHDDLIQEKMKKPDKYSIIKDGILFRECKNKSKVPFLPKSLIKEVLQAFHDHLSAAHFGRNRTYTNITKRCYWPNMYLDIKNYVRSCDTCARHNIPRNKPPGHLQSIPPPEGIFDLVGLDFWGPASEPSTNGNKYILVLTDYMSKFVIARATPHNNAQTVAEFIVEVASTFGVPKQLLTDQGTHFNNELVNAIAQLLGCHHTLSTAYHPQTNGQVERWNATMRPQLNKLASQQPADWDKYLSAVVSAYNNGEHDTTGITPFELMFGRNPSMVFDPTKPMVQLSKPSDYLVHMRTFRAIQIQSARSNTQIQQVRMKQRYDKSRSNPRYDLNDLVLVRTPPPQRHKGAEIYQGPYRIIQLIHSNTYIVEQVHTGDQRRVHTSMLKPIFERI
ncbi:unnamed protein product [Adineta steineri]|uniref:Endonuclease n=1 Tax=Adineta steineri TaxID=433720 RepID=A0A818ZQ95_9BILA|nr:unnamed protein product [Adineta steineri]CAF3773196.1 unnamed protein product [Adineta steineri]